MNSKRQPIAIVGLACRFPGDCNSPEEFWKQLCSGQDVITDIRADRWSRDFYFHPDLKATGKTYSARAGQLSDVYHFDPEFFGISPREASQMDPQQRLLLQMSWEALEDGGQTRERIAGSDCSVFIGISSLDYANNRMDDPNVADAYFMTGNTLSIAANRISYMYDLHGPSMAIDTACSSSLVALHQACNSIWAGESSSSLVGAVHLVLSPFPFIGFSKASMLSRDGSCKVFDASADGYVRSEGGVVLYLKPLADALRDGDPIHAVIRGTGVNSDGNKSSLTVPNGAAQTRLLKQVYGAAGVDIRDIDYIESHGTGTPVGDPIEAEALGAFIRDARPASAPMLIGSVKSNIGHLEPASGLAGLLKVVMCLRHRSIPATIHHHTPNPNIDFKGLNLSVVASNTTLSERDRPLLMGVNSFGFGGTNAHCILEEYVAEDSLADTQAPASLPPLYLSAMSEASLRARASQFVELLASETDPARLYALFHTCARKRQRLKYALVAFGAEISTIRSALADFVIGKRNDNLVRVDMPAETGGIGMVFSGNGCQWAGMGRSLLGHPVFAGTVEQIDKHFEPLAGWSLSEAMRAEADGTSLEYTEVAQPILFALQLGMVALYRDLGIEPVAVCGHSVGEIAAAHVAGALTLEDAVKVIYHRSSAQGRTRGKGRMAAVRLSPEDMQPLLDVHDGVLEIAAVNSEDSVTISGDATAIAMMVESLQENAVSCRELDIDYAFHSRHMDAIESQVIEGLGDISPVACTLEFISTVTGGTLSGTELDAGYWWRNIRRPVSFGSAVRAMMDTGVRHYIEVGSHPVLQSYIRDMLRHHGVQGTFTRSTVRGDTDEIRSIQAAAFRSLFTRDEPCLDRLFPVSVKPVELPPYPWHTKEYSFSGSNEAINRYREHPLLGYRVNGVEGVWTNQIDLTTCSWLQDHVVDETVVFPAACYTEMALAAAASWFGKVQPDIAQLEIRKPMILEPGKTRVLQFTLSARDLVFSIRSRERLSEESWIEHVTGRLLNASTSHETVRADLVAWSENRAVEIGAEAVYQRASLAGLSYGQCFRGVHRVLRFPDSVVAELVCPEGLTDISTYLLHPVMLDSAFHALLPLLDEKNVHTATDTLLPAELRSIRVYTPGTPPAWVECRLLSTDSAPVTAAFVFYDTNGRCLAEVGFCQLRRLPRNGSKRGADMYRWQHIPKNLINPLLPTPLPSTTALLDAVADMPDRSALLASEQIENEHVLPLFDALASAIAEATFRGFGAHLGQFTVDSLISAAQTDPVYRNHLVYMLNILEQDGKAYRKGDSWKMLDSDDIVDPVDIWRSLLADHPGYIDVLRDTASHGLRALDILAGHVQERQEDRRRVYRFPDNGDTGLQQHLLEAVISRVISEWPRSQRRLRIAELRNRKSASSSGLISQLAARYCDFEILAMDDATVSLAEEMYRDADNVTISRFDPGKGGVQQKYREGEFDIVLIGDGLHRDMPLAEILSQMSYLLASAGLLLMAGIRPGRITDINTGLANPDWWRLAESGATPLSGHLHPEEWQYLLEECGYQEVHNLADSLMPELYRYSLIARRPVRSETPVTARAESPASEYVLIACDDGRSLQLARLLKTESGKDGVRTTMLVGGEESTTADNHVSAAPIEDITPDDLALLLDTQISQTLKIVYLASLDEAYSESTGQDIGNRISRANFRLVRLLQAVTDPTLGINASIRVVTSGAVTVTDGEEGTDKSNPYQAGIWALGRVIRNEYPDMDFRMIDLQLAGSSGHIARQLWHELTNGDGEEEVILSDEGRRVPRLIRLESVVTGPARDVPEEEDRLLRLGFTRAGSVDNLCWTSQARSQPGVDEIEIEVRASGLNFRDIMYTSGFLPDEMLEGGLSGASLGLECAGVVTRVGTAVSDYHPGDEVIALAPACFSSHVIASRHAVMKKPLDWSFEAAATVPTAFFTVYYALAHLARLRRGERILIHGAAGAVGLAAIQYAHYCGAEIYATAGSEEKRRFLQLLGVNHILDSRKLEFADQIMALTDNHGVDVVLNSLAGEAMFRSFGMVGAFGRFIELGKRDFYENTRLDLKPFRNNITYFGVDADQLLSHQPGLSAELMKDVMALFEKGVFRPLPYTVFNALDVAHAFRYMQQSQQIGKVIVTHGVTMPDLDEASPAGILEIDPRASYLVTGGTSGFGLATAAWLAERGARHLVLVSRRGIADESSAREIARIQAAGTEVRIVPCDVSDAIKMQTVLHEIEESSYPLRGIVHAAMVLDDALIRNMSHEAMSRVILPKVQGAWNLHRLTRDSTLDFFVMYSSATSCIGNPGQGNYVAANAFMESLARFRRQSGLPATVIGWDAITDTGYLARNEQLAGRLTKRLGLGGITARQALETMEALIVSGHTDTTVFNANWGALRRSLPILKSHQYRSVMRGQNQYEGMEGEDLYELLARLDNAERQPVIVSFLIGETARILQMPEEKIAHNSTIQELGIDSLMAMELANTIETRLGINLPVLTLADNATLDSLANRIVNMLDPGEGSDRAGDAARDIVSSLARIHAEDLSGEELDMLSADLARGNGNPRRLIQ